MPRRLDQIEELTRGIDLPLTPLHQAHCRFIIEKVSHAWTDLLQRQQTVLRERPEAEITALLESRLRTLLDEDPLWAQMVRAIARGCETISFDGTHLEKRPDLSLFLTRPPAAFPFTIECKIVDEPNGQTVNVYCNRGLSRFLAGEYAWATKEALMIAYVRDRSTIESHLAPALASKGSSSPAPYAIEDGLSVIAVDIFEVAKSTHGRGFRYPLRQPPRDEPGGITLWHLWLDALTNVARRTNAAIMSE